MVYKLNIFKTFIFRSFIKPFFLTFAIVIVILLMQFLWKYIDDLIGKGLELSIVFELLWYSSITLIPLALPLAVLLSSMMLTGQLSEKSELTAINSIGRPFTYIMGPLLLFSFFIALCSFLISNYSIPYANLKASTLMYDIMKKKLNINIKEKVFFSEIEGYSIRVNEKEGDEVLKDIIIYDYTQNNGVKKVFIAESGKMSINNENNRLFISLYNGQSYNDIISDDQEYNIKTKFYQYNLALDLSAFKMERTDLDRFSNRAKTMNISQLINNIDSLNNNITYLQNQILLNFIDYNQIYSNQKKNKISNIKDVKKLINNHNNQEKLIIKKINKFEVEKHRKWTLSLACLIMLIIGAPIGAIIKKGGFGLPVVFSIFLFLIYHIMSITGEKMVKKDVIEPVLGMWTPSIIMLFIGLYLIVIVNNNYFEKIWLKR
ncbi:MAG: hypothetical protein CMD26_01730 [Flavobacteriales bacterium]|nr:hypothetical protein [Flavobacteriales bacterium]